MTTIEYVITDWHKEGVMLNPKDKNRYDAKVVEHHDGYSTQHGVYFPTKRQAQAWIKEQKKS